MKMKERRVKKVTFRLTEAEHEVLSRTAEFLGCRPSDAIRMGLSSVNLAAGELASAK